MTNKEIEFKGWAIDIDFLESQIALCRNYGVKELRFGVAGITKDKTSEFIDPEKAKVYDHEKYKLYVRGVAYLMTAMATNVLTTSLTPNSTFDDFPPIPPEPMQDPG